MKAMALAQKIIIFLSNTSPIFVDIPGLIGYCYGEARGLKKIYNQLYCHSWSGMRINI